MSFFNKKKKSVGGSNNSGTISPRNAAMFILVVAALGLALVPSISSMARTAAAQEPLNSQQSIIARDAVGNIGGGDEGDQGNDNGGAGGVPPGAKAIIGGNIGATKQFSLDINAPGKVSGSNANAFVHIEGVVDIDSKKGTIIRVQEGSVSGNAEIKDNKGNTAATYDLSNISLKASGAKLTVNADFTDQDGDKGKLAASLFTENKINANSATITFNGNSNHLSLKYNPPVTQQFVATGKNVEGELALT